MSQQVQLMVDVPYEHHATLAQVEDAYVNKIMFECCGNKTKAAKLLGIDRRTLYRKLSKMREANG